MKKMGIYFIDWCKNSSYVDIYLDRVTKQQHNIFRNDLIEIDKSTFKTLRIRLRKGR